ncbi:glycosyltransferase [Marinactinospora rubrisoli]|uniref:Glycosyltransferase n=1 Tax=Marinactinospora rubrisoli TaxID=2715399 RepID=A0ABW2KIY6_9ACTN
MRIGLFTDYFLPAVGGVQTLVAAQHRLLTERGHDVTIVCASYGQRRDMRAAHVIHLPSAARLAFDQHRPYLPLPHHQRRLVAEIARRGGFDIVHGHTEFGLSMAARAVARACDAPYVVTMHTLMHRQLEDTFADPLLWSRRLVRLQRLMLRPGPDTYRPAEDATPAQHNVWRFMVRHANTADAVLVPSRHFAEKLADRGVRPPLHVVPNVTVTARDRPERTAAREPTIVWAGRLSAEKRVLPFLEALRTLPPTGWRAEVYGGGAQERECRAFLAAHPMPVRLFGARPHAEVLAALDRADIAAITSCGFDNHPMAVVEAVAAGLPILACDPDLSEGVTPENAVLTEPDPAAIGAGLGRLVRDAGLRAALAAGSRRLAADYTGERFAERLERVYREALAGRRTARSRSA